MKPLRREAIDSGSLPERMATSGPESPFGDDDADLLLVPSLCPRCGQRPIEDDRTGFCYTCATEKLGDDYAAKDAESAARRRQRLMDRGDAARDRWRVRQQRHRSAEKCRPQVPLGPGDDPLVLCENALAALKDVRATIQTHARWAMPRARPHLELVEESIKQLAWTS